MTENFPAEKTFRFIRLNVSAPFHSRLMKTIEGRFADTLEKFGNNLNAQNASKVTSNFTGGFHSDDVSEVKKNLINQISNTVIGGKICRLWRKKPRKFTKSGRAAPARFF